MCYFVRDICILRSYAKELHFEHKFLGKFGQRLLTRRLTSGVWSAYGGVGETK